MLKINYDSLGKVANISILIENYYAEVPYSKQTKSIDWEIITYEPTRTSIKNAWEQWGKGKDLNYELRDRPDLAPPAPQPQPNWGEFNVAMMSDVVYNRIASQTINQRSVARIEAIVADYAGGTSPNYLILKNLWDSIIDGLSVVNKLKNQEVINLNQMIKKCNLLFSIATDGKMVNN